MREPVFSYADSSTPPMKRGLIRLVEVATGQRRLKRIYFENRRHPVEGESFWEAAVRGLALNVRYDAAALAAIPVTGPVVVVANHPYGVLDGIVIAWLISKVRTDFLVLTNALLLRAPELDDFVLPIDFSGTEHATRTNLKSRALARHHLDTGGCVVVFPSGAISTAPDRLGRERAVDGPWQPFTAQLVQRARATVVPVCFEGQNSRLFQIASHISPVLRLSLIFREVNSRIGTDMRVAVGAPIAYGALASTRDRQAFSDDLKARTYALACTFPALDPGSTSRGGPRRRHGTSPPRRFLAPLDALKRKTKLPKPGWARRFGKDRPRQPRPR